MDSGTAARTSVPAEVDELWERRAELTPEDADVRKLITGAVDLIDAGEVRVAWIDAETDKVLVDERAKRAILLAFRVMPMVASQVGDFRYHDRVPLTSHLDGVRIRSGRHRAVGCLCRARRRAHALIREYRGVRGLGHDGGYLGDGRLSVRRSARMSIFPAESASAGCSSRPTRYLS